MPFYFPPLLNVLYGVTDFEGDGCPLMVQPRRPRPAAAVAGICAVWPTERLLHGLRIGRLLTRNLLEDVLDVKLLFGLRVRLKVSFERIAGKGAILLLSRNPQNDCLQSCARQ